MDNEQMYRLLNAIDEIKQAKEPKSKDAWDKVAIFIQILSGVVLVIIGLFVTLSIQNAQQALAQKIAEAQNQTSTEIAKAQIDSASKISEVQSASSKNIAASQADTSKEIARAQTASQELTQKLSLAVTQQQLASEYLAKLTNATSPSDRATLLDALDLALEPKFSVPLALRFTRPVQVVADICKGQISDDRDSKEQERRLINKTAINLLHRLAVKNPEMLMQASRSGLQPEASIARAVLGESRVLFRVSEIDDFADVYLNNDLIGTYQFGKESGWVDVTDRLLANSDNSIYVLVRNSPYEGTQVRFEIRAGAEQYDRLVRRKDWTGEGEAFSIGFSISVDVHGGHHLNGDNIVVRGPVGIPHCK